MDEEKKGTEKTHYLSNSGKPIHRVKIIDKMRKCLEEKKTFYSFEYFPPKTPAGVQNLYARLDRMASLEPMFMDVTWGAGGSTADLTLDISSTAQNSCTPEIMMHLTCTNMPRQSVADALKKAKEAGIKNILALRGDPPKGADTWEQCEDGFAHAIDLVKFIRKEYGDYFGVCVAGYPEGHNTCTSLDDDIKHLKEKVEAGADFIITQLFYDVDLFISWYKKCRAAGITVPILPGIMLIQNYQGFKRMTTFCKTSVPKEVETALEPIQHDDARVKAYGIELATAMCKKLLDFGLLGLHFCTLNLERSVMMTLERLGFITARTGPQEVPWVKSQVVRRNKESTRPIFWANRPKSYLDRTMMWDDFPNGRWGDSASPAFGELSDYHLVGFSAGKAADRLKIWGKAPATPKDIYEVFVGYILGKVPRLPWCEHSLNLETIPMRDTLRALNLNGFLTINSQPAVNGADSTDPGVGWGGPGGYVYQKAYLEFFASPSNVEKMLKVLADFPAITYTAVNAQGKSTSNVNFTETGAVNAVTWGVWPGKQIDQPTVVDQNVFCSSWKDEAFALWTSQWKSIYAAGSVSSELIQEVHDTFYLVNVVDNDYIKGDIFKFIEKLIA